MLKSRAPGRHGEYVFYSGAYYRICGPSVNFDNTPVGSIVGALYHKLQTQSSTAEDGRNDRRYEVSQTRSLNLT